MQVNCVCVKDIIKYKLHLLVFKNWNGQKAVR